MKNVKILDCTLRDGGRIIDCEFSDMETAEITGKLTKAGIDIVEVGFLRDWRDTTYEGNSTFFTDVDQISPFLPKSDRTTYVAFVDYGMFDFDSLKQMDSRSITGIRIGFTKNDYVEQYDDLVRCLNHVKSKDYQLFIQGVNSLNYTDKELLTIVEMVNEIKPVAFGIVDTYGAMYVDDVARLYNLIDNNMHKDIAIDFHSHNNFQLSFSFAQEVIKLSRGVRSIIIDATLNGMGKGAGNLNTELIADFMVRKMAYDYDIDMLFDAIDEHLYDLQQKHHWGYSTSALMSGIYKSHPNNVIYLTEKFRLDTKDIKNILSALDEQERQRYDYGKLDLLTQDYNDKKYDDRSEIFKLRECFSDRPILLLAPGASLNSHRAIIEGYVAEKEPIVISVNFVSDIPSTFSFFANKKRYAHSSKSEGPAVIVTSDIAQGLKNETIVNYHSLVNRGYKLFDNSVIMLLNLLKRAQVKEIAIAGLDGFSKDAANYYDPSLNVERLASRLDEINEGVSEILADHVAAVSGVCNISLITPSVFDSVFA